MEPRARSQREVDLNLLRALDLIEVLLLGDLDALLGLDQEDDEAVLPRQTDADVDPTRLILPVPERSRRQGSGPPESDLLRRATGVTRTPRRTVTRPPETTVSTGEDL